MNVRRNALVTSAACAVVAMLGLAISVTSTGAASPPAVGPNHNSDGAPSGQTVPAEVPAPNPGKDLTNNGPGPVITNPVVYTDFWLPPGTHYESANTAASDTNYENLTNSFFQNVGDNDYHNLLSQYTGQNPSGTISNSTTNLLGGTWIDTSAYTGGRGSASNPLTDADIQNEATAAATHFGLTQSLNVLIFVYTSFSTDECFGSDNGGAGGSGCNYGSSSYCAYHDNYDSGNAIYAFMGDAAGETTPSYGCELGIDGPGPSGPSPNNDLAADSEISVESHEFAESETDPDLNAWYQGSTSGEIGDQCNLTGGPRNSIGADVYLNGHPYIIQEMWSNAVEACALDINSALTSVQAPVLTVTTTAPATGVIAQSFAESITVYNPSNTDAATEVVLTDPLPANVSYVASSANVAPSSTSPLTWNIGTLAVHDTKTFTFDVTSSQAQSVNNCASAAYDDMLEIKSYSQTGCAPTNIPKQTPTITTVASPKTGVGLTASDTATLGSGYQPTGSITFNLYGPSDPSCGNPPAFTTTVNPVTGDGSYTTPNFTPTEPGTYNWVATYNGDENNNTATESCGTAGESVTVVPVISPTYAALTANGCKAYSQTFTTGFSGYTYTISQAPPGLQLSSAGVLSGTPTKAGKYAFTIYATNGTFSVSRAYVLTEGLCVNPNTGMLPSGTYEHAYSATVTASGGTAPYRFQLQSGSLPLGLTMSSSGVISGTPYERGTFTITVVATDSANPANEGSNTFTFTIS